MAKQVTELETKMDDLFGKKAPKMPSGGVKVITEWAPWLALIAGAFSLISAYSLWHWAHAVDNAASYVNSLCNAYAVNAGACSSARADRFSLWLWLALIVLAIEGVLYLLAYSGLKARTKDGWNYLFYGALVNVVYAVLSLFTSYDVAGHFLSAIIGSAFAFWVLFQIRSVYTGAKPVAAKHDTPKVS